MKDSGIEWIEQIPKEWDVSKLKYSSSFVNGDRSENYPSPSDFVDEGILFVTSNNIHEQKLDLDVESKYITQDKYKKLRGAKLEKDDLIYCLRGSVGLCSINKTVDEGTVASSLVIIKPKTINADYLSFLMQSKINYFQTAIYTNGSCAANLSAENVANYYFIEPPVSEQKLIADFLDKQTSKIDSIIKINEQQLEILKKYKKSLITQTVTKGLDKNVKMKDSGIEWIGQIPEDWEIKRFKYIHFGTNVGESIDKEYWSSDGKGYVFYTAGETSIYCTYKDFPKWKYVNKTDLLLSRNGTPYIYLPPEEALYSDHIIRAKIINKYDKRYVRYCMQLSIETEKIEVVSLATWSVSIWNEQKIPVADFFEQEQIADFLDEKCSKIDSIIAQKQQAIETMQRYKKSLIYEYVTGKKRVN